MYFLTNQIIISLNVHKTHRMGVERHKYKTDGKISVFSFTPF